MASGSLKVALLRDALVAEIFGDDGELAALIPGTHRIDLDTRSTSDMSRRVFPP